MSCALVDTAGAFGPVAEACCMRFLTVVFQCFPLPLAEKVTDWTDVCHAWAHGRMDVMHGRMDAERMDAERMDAWMLRAWMLNAWTHAERMDAERMDAERMDAWMLNAWMHGC